MKRVRFEVVGRSVILPDLGIEVHRSPPPPDAAIPKVTPETRSVAIALQGGACAVCRVTDKKLEMDHDHQTGEPRGYLCKSCNVRLGHMERHPPVPAGPFRDYVGGTK